MQLGYKDQADLAKASGLSKNTAGALEQQRKVSDKTVTAIEIALRWAPGSVDSILAGGDPVEIVPVSDSATMTESAVIDVRKASPEELAAAFLDMAHDHSDAEILEVMSQVMRLRAQGSAARDAG
jgi:DNA-binding XRE family transcriptional regulator